MCKYCCNGEMVSLKDLKIKLIDCQFDLFISITATANKFSNKYFRFDLICKLLLNQDDIKWAC